MEIDAETATELQAWLLADPLELEAAVTLAVGCIPLMGRRRSATFSPLLRAAEAALERGELKPANDWQSIKSRRHYGSSYVEPKVAQAVFRSWLDKSLSGELRNNAFFFLAPVSDWPIGNGPVMNARAHNWPWGDHETANLRHLAAAAEKFWKLYDPEQPDTAPKSEQVSNWLREERGVPVRVAEIMAQILRADGLPAGPRK